MNESEADNERARSEAELRRLEARFSAIFYASPVGVAINSLVDGRIIDVNDSFLEIVGYERAEVIGRTSTELGLWVDADVRARVIDALHARGRVRDAELRIRTKGGAIRHLLYAIERIDLGGELCMLSYGQDITARKQAEEALQASEEYLRALVEHSSEIIIVFDRAGTVRLVSPAWERVLGHAGVDSGATAFDLVHPDDWGRLREFFQDMLAAPDTVFTCELRVRHADGTWRELEVTATNLLDNPAVRGIVTNSRDITDRKRTAEQLIHDAFHDQLTGLSNRALFLDRLRQALERSQRGSGRSCAVLFLDLDRFKTVNDSLGHLAGDQLLVEVARRIVPLLRPTDTVARLGGDEFAILLEDLTETRSARDVAERLTGVFQRPFSVAGHEIVTGASIGIAVSEHGSTEPEDLLRDADIAMYRAKRGNHAYVIADRSMHMAILSRVRLEAELRTALEREEFVLHYQPKTAMDGTTIVGVEALIRWQHPVRGLLGPGMFIPLAEETGLMTPIGTWVLRTACAQLQAWLAEGIPPLFVAVNLSVQQFQQPDLGAVIRDVLVTTGLDPQYLCLELTETMLMENAPATIAVLHELRNTGIRALAIDDFGTGYSSLSYLQRLPVTEIKIDRSFVRDITSNPSNAAIAVAIIALAHSLGLKAIGEGVETEEQRAFLQAAGCDRLQGFLVSRPLPPDELVAFLQARPERSGRYNHT